jgi:hypothetical protein
MVAVKLLKLRPFKRVAVLLGCITLVVSGLVVAGSVSAAPASAATCKRHVFYVDTERYGGNIWSVYGDLYAGNGQRVYHWQEEGKPAGEGSVWWEFTYCGDGGWAHIWIYPDPRKGPYFYQGLDLNYSYHWRIRSNSTVYLMEKV